MCYGAQFRLAHRREHPTPLLGHWTIEADDSRSGRTEADQNTPPIVGIGQAANQTPVLQPIDKSGNRRRGEPGLACYGGRRLRAFDQIAETVHFRMRQGKTPGDRVVKALGRGLPALDEATDAGNEGGFGQGLDSFIRFFDISIFEVSDRLVKPLAKENRMSALTQDPDREAAVVGAAMAWSGWGSPVGLGILIVCVAIGALLVRFAIYGF